MATQPDRMRSGATAPRGRECNQKTAQTTASYDESAPPTARMASPADGGAVDAPLSLRRRTCTRTRSAPRATVESALALARAVGSAWSVQRMPMYLRTGAHSSAHSPCGGRGALRSVLEAADGVRRIGPVPFVGASMGAAFIHGRFSGRRSDACPREAVKLRECSGVAQGAVREMQHASLMLVTHPPARSAL